SPAGTRRASCVSGRKIEAPIVTILTPACFCQVKSPFFTFLSHSSNKLRVSTACIWRDVTIPVLRWRRGRHLHGASLRSNVQKNRRFDDLYAPQARLRRSGCNDVPSGVACTLTSGSFK